MNKISLDQLHTFGCPVKAQTYQAIRQLDDLRDLLPLSKPYLILGGGSNMLFTKDFEGLVLHNQIKGIQILKESATEVWVEAGAGEVWQDLVNWAVASDYGGIENLSLIPGSVGAAPIQNIGAYGVELEQVFDHLKAVNLETGKVQLFDRAACAFAYRDSIFKQALKGKFLISQVCLKLSKQPIFNTSYGAIQQVLEEQGGELSVAKISAAVCAIRQSKLPDPKEIGSAGSFFKNPLVPKEVAQILKANHPNLPIYPSTNGRLKLSAGWLIDQAGWKGYRKGDAGVYQHQALVLVNHGQATGQEIWELAKAVQASVQKRYGILLEPEVNVFL